MEENIKEDIGESQIYELGYHLLSTVSEEDITAEVVKIHEIISQNSGVVIGEGLPILRELAYEMTKRIDTKNSRFSKAYFGWVKFEVDRANILNIKTKIENLPNVLRSLILKTVRENTMHTPKAPVFKREYVKEEASFDPEKKKVEVSEEEIDKSIDELLVSEN